MITFHALDIDRDWPTLGPIMEVRLCEDTKGIIGVDAEGDYVACALLDSWSHTAVQAHIWIRNPLAIKAGFLTEIANYVYGFGGREIIVGLVPADNQKALNFDRRIGFTEIGRIKDGHAVGVDVVILEMRKDDCRWFTYGKEGSRAA